MNSVNVHVEKFDLETNSLLIKFSCIDNGKEYITDLTNYNLYNLQNVDDIDNILKDLARAGVHYLKQEIKKENFKNNNLNFSHLEGSQISFQLDELFQDLESNVLITNLDTLEVEL